MIRGNIALIALFFCSIVLLQCNAQITNNIVSTTEGVVQGYSTSTHRIWKGIPYAAPPVGPLRWQSPQARAPWSGILQTVNYSSICPQSAGGSEDCLYLNIFVPIGHNPATDALLGVLFYIHGGGYANGAGSNQDGVKISGTDVIFITINYRLGALGFLAHTSLLNSASNADGVGYYGIQDQRAALQWVQRNIAAFGGDPSRVTAAGGSAGAMSLCFHSVSPRSNGLFSQAISQSGQCTINTAAEGLAYGNIVATALGCNSSSDAYTLACLKNATRTQIVTAAALVYPFQPTSFPNEIPNGALPLDILAAGQGARFPILLGTNLNEQAIAVCRSYANANQATITSLISAHYSSPTATSELLAAYPFSNYSTPAQQYIDEYSDYWFKCPTRNIAEAFYESDAPVYMYSYELQGAFVRQVSPLASCLGVHHTAELAMFYGTSVVASAAGGSLTAEEEALSVKIRNAWASFVNTGVPTLPELAWPTFNPETGAYVRFNLTITLGSHFRESYCALHDKLAEDSRPTAAPTALPTAAPCSVRVSVAQRGSSWVNGGVSQQLYDLYITNTGTRKVNALSVSLSPNPDVSSSWNIHRVGSSNVFTVDTWGLSVGSSYNAQHGFIANGNPTTITAAVVSASC